MYKRSAINIYKIKLKYPIHKKVNINNHVHCPKVF